MSSHSIHNGQNNCGSSCFILIVMVYPSDLFAIMIPLDDYKQTVIASWIGVLRFNKLRIQGNRLSV